MLQTELNFTSIIRRLVRPAIRFCLRRSLKIQDILHAVKLEFVSLAREELTSNKQQISISRLSAMTGLQRKDINTLTNEGKSTKNLEGSGGNLIYRLINRWSQDRKYIRSDGKARQLSTDGVSSEFADLVRQISTDLNHHTILFELERLHLIKRDGSKVTLLSNVYSNQQDVTEALVDTAQDIDDIYRTTEHNILAKPEDIQLHARTTYDNIAVKDIPKIRQWILEKGSQLHSQIRTFLSKYDRDLSTSKPVPGSGRTRIVVGTFNYAEVIEQGESNGGANDVK